MPGIIINPGSGPVAEATEDAALENIKAFCQDCPGEGIHWGRDPKRDEDGRFGFILRKDGSIRTHTVDMPGIPLERVRYLGNPDQNIWHFPRLYVDDSSWVWKFAILGEEDWEPIED